MTREALVFYSEFDDPVAWRRALAAELPDLDFRVAPEIGDPADVRYVLAWKPPPGFFAPFRNLALVVNLGAGVDSLVGRDDLPEVPISRLSDPRHGLADDELRAVRRHPPRPRYPALRARAAPAANGTTSIHARSRASASACSGSASSAAPPPKRWRGVGFDVRGWSRTPKSIPGVRCVAGARDARRFLARERHPGRHAAVDAGDARPARRAPARPAAARRQADQRVARRHRRRAGADRGAARRARSRRRRSMCSRSSRCRPSIRSGAWTTC